LLLVQKSGVGNSFADINDIGTRHVVMPTWPLVIGQNPKKTEKEKHGRNRIEEKTDRACKNVNGRF
jgi:hypothetical protein